MLDESVLRRTAVAPGQDGGTTVLRGQLEWLADAAARPNVTLQVLPFAAGLPPVTAGSFSVLESRATGTPDVVYLENKTRVFYLDTEAEVQRYEQAFDLLSRMALDPADSLDLIRRTADAALSPRARRSPSGRGDARAVPQRGPPARPLSGRHGKRLGRGSQQDHVGTRAAGAPLSAPEREERT